MLSPEGVLAVTTPSGVTRTTRPPGLQPFPGEPAHLAHMSDDPPPF